MSFVKILTEKEFLELYSGGKLSDCALKFIFAYEDERGFRQFGEIADYSEFNEEYFRELLPGEYDEWDNSFNLENGNKLIHSEC